MGLSGGNGSEIEVQVAKQIAVKLAYLSLRGTKGVFSAMFQKSLISTCSYIHIIYINKCKECAKDAIMEF